MKHDKRLIAINLPQFHPFKENDEWWGKGFTEWTNVVKARPRFKGHYQPHLPADTGFYDLRLPEARQMQADLAKKYGIYGFCYYHYWFNGRQLMERPVNEILKTGKPDFPFMLCWANENWTRMWDGLNKEILIEQKHSEEDDILHMEFLCKNVFNDPRYIRINGRPFFAIYKPTLMPNIQKTIAIWREIANKYHIDLYLGFMRSSKVNKQKLLNAGFDVSIDFEPDFDNPLWNKQSSKWWLDPVVYRDEFYRRILKRNPPAKANLIDYEKYISNYTIDTSIKEFPGITPSWDNAPRRLGKDFAAFVNSTPKTYGTWLRKILDLFIPFSKEENFVFINAWNEWAEGNHLEPDQKWGLKYLEETKRQLDI